VEQLGTKVSDGSLIEVDGVTVNRDIPHIYLMLNKPRGYLCSTREDDHRSIVYDLLDPSYRSYGLFSVGRLDYNSEGMLLLTNDGDFAHAVAHPSGGVLKRYEVTVSQNIPYKVIAAWKNGVYIKGESFSIHDFRKISSKKVILTLSEGKNREIRKLFSSIDIDIVKLKRIAIGSLDLGSLPPGRCRELTRNEITRIFDPSP
jgi:23S rRNA pseudouridine2605 synthase